MNSKNGDNISIQDFKKLNIAVGTIIEAFQNTKAKKAAYILKIDFGKKIGIKSTSAQITNYSMDELIGRQIVGVVNFPPKQIGPIMSECLVLGAVSGKDVRLLHPDVKVENGLQIS